jgi:DNA-binding NtrC family response regulator
MPKTVLIVDDDLGFVLWLGQALAVNGFSALPAVRIRDAALLLKRIESRVDVLTINLALTGAGGFITALRRSHPNVRVISILNDDQKARHVRRVNAARARPSAFDALAQSDWAEFIGAV